MRERDLRKTSSRLKGRSEGETKKKKKKIDEAGRDRFGVIRRKTAAYFWSFRSLIISLITP